MNKLKLIQKRKRKKRIKLEDLIYFDNEVKFNLCLK